MEEGEGLCKLYMDLRNEPDTRAYIESSLFVIRSDFSLGK